MSNIRELRCGTRGRLLSLWCLLVGLWLGAYPAPVRADESGDDKTWSKVSKSLVPFLVAGEVSLLTSGDGGTRKATRAAGALLITGALTEGLKRVTRQKRPDNDERDSFPSNHASLSFAMAISGLWCGVGDFLFACAGESAPLARGHRWRRTGIFRCQARHARTPRRARRARILNDNYIHNHVCSHVGADGRCSYVISRSGQRRAE